MSKILAVSKDALADGPSSPGVVRQLAFGDDGTHVIRSRAQPGAVSGWHHHGDHDVFGYLAAGAIMLESGPGGRDTTHIVCGDFFHIPPRTVHRERNPSANEQQEVVLFLQGSGPLVVSTDGPLRDDD